MKTLLFALLISLTCLCSAARGKAGKSENPVAVDPFEQVKQMGRGVNVIGYDPFWRDEAKARFKEHHFKRIQEGGFQTIRVNLHAFRHMDGENKIDESWLRKLDWVIDRALANKLIVILDEHDFQAIGKDAEGNTPRLLACWKQIAERYQSKPSEVVFEILNEPNSALTSEKWNDLLKEALGVIRRSNPARNVIIGPAAWNSINELRTLELPEEDRHIIVTVHYYLPFRFTHQGASWTESTAKLSGIRWGTERERKDLANDFDRVQKWAKAHRRPILLGEFGAYDKADMESRVAYTSAVARAAEERGWAWAYWQFDSDFVVYDMGKDDWNWPIYRALVPERK